jgi:putative ABC transport system permease protein
VERELDEELRAYVELLTEEKVKAGLDAEEARRLSLIEMGGLDQVKERVRDVRVGAMMETFLHDIRYNLRVLIKNPGFAAIAVITLALGIGANSAIFSVVNAVLLRPLPFADPERLVQVWEYRPRQGLNTQNVSSAEFTAWHDQNQVFEEVAAIDVAEYNLTGGDEPERVGGARVSASYFPLLGIKALLGRTFLREEDQPDHDDVVVLSHGLWQRRFGSDPNIVNTSLTLNGKVCTIVGVMPSGFKLPQNADLARPIAFSSEEQTKPGDHYLEVIARLKPGITIKQAGTEMSAIANRLEQTFPTTNLGHGVVLVPLHEQIVGEIRPALLILFGSVGFVLLIACANVANLLLARASGRRKELAIRAALGAGRLRIVRQLLTESMLLAVVGGVLGLLTATWGVDLLVGLSPNSIPRASEISLDARVLVFTFLVTLITGLLFGLLPAWQTSRLELTEALKEGDRGSTEGFRSNRARSLLIVSEFALTLVLLIGAGLLIKSFQRLSDVNPGFEPANLLTLELSLPASRYTDGNKVADFYEQVLPRIESLPGVQSVGVVTVLPLSGNDNSSFVTIEGHPPLPPGEALRAGYRVISPNYFSAMGIPLKRGRLLTPADNRDAARVVLINEAMAQRFFQPGEDPIGKRIRTGGGDSPWLSVAGIVADVKHNGLDRDARPEIYASYLQSPKRSMTLVVRSQTDPLKLVGPVRDQVRLVDKDQPIGNIRSMEQLLAESVAPRRFSMLLLSIFAVVAMLLAAVGIYGVMNYSVARRTHEIGIRMALGARSMDVLRLIVGQGMMLAAVGLGIGLLAGVVVTRLMSSLLFEVSTIDPAIFLAASVLLAGAALLASYIPARRASRVDPMIAMRYE